MGSAHELYDILYISLINKNISFAYDIQMKPDHFLNNRVTLELKLVNF